MWSLTSCSKLRVHLGDKTGTTGCLFERPPHRQQVVSVGVANLDSRLVQVKKEVPSCERSMGWCDLLPVEGGWYEVQWACSESMQ